MDFAQFLKIPIFISFSHTTHEKSGHEGTKKYQRQSSLGKYHRRSIQSEHLDT